MNNHTVFSMCLLALSGDPVFLRAPCELIDLHGVDLAVHHPCKSQLMLALDHDYWAISCPLIGRQMFESEKLQNREEFIQKVRNRLIPKLERKHKAPFHEIVEQMRQVPAPHPQSLKRSIQ